MSLTLLGRNGTSTTIDQIWSEATTPVDPYYLIQKAKEVRYHPQVILAGRTFNDGMPKYVAEIKVKGLNKVRKVIKGSNVLIMGLTYKDDMGDIRNPSLRS